MTKTQVGIFSGSFNPIHVGHLILANYMSQFTYLDEVWMLVTPHNPLKNSSGLEDDRLRLQMVQLALKDFGNIKPSDVEFSMPTPSYTIDTLNSLRETYPDKEFTLIIGGDNWTRFSEWKDYTVILANYRVLIYPRLGEEITVAEKYQKHVQVVKAPLVEVSSTFIRDSIRAGKDVRAFVPDEVYNFILKNNLYQ